MPNRMSNGVYGMPLINFNVTPFFIYLFRNDTYNDTCYAEKNN